MRVALRLLFNLLRLPFWPLYLLKRLVVRPRGDTVLVRLRPRIVELMRPLPFFVHWIPGFASALPTSLVVLRRLGHAILRDTRVRTVVFEVPPLASGWASCAGVRELLVTLRKGGKRVVVYLPEGGGNRELYIASAADRILLAPQATVSLLGFAAERLYFKPLLDRLGLVVDVHARGDYKTAAESFARETMSEPQREQTTALLTTLDRTLVSALCERPGMDEARARAAIELGLLHGARAVEAGVVDGVCYEDELGAALTPDGQPRARIVRAPRYLAWHERRFFRHVVRRPYVAVIPVHGVIAQGSQDQGARGASLAHVVTAIRMAGLDRYAVGVVLHVDSPGGSALASDLIHRELVRLREKKPLVACFGDVAASGGYYVGAPASVIVAQPVTITGSIGVISAKLVATGALEKLGVRAETVRTAPHADMFSVTRGLDDAEREILERETGAFYETFVTVVAQGRGKPTHEVEALARGRVWSGADAKERGLVDRFGGLDAAVEEVLARSRVPEPLRAFVEPAMLAPGRRELPPPAPPAAKAPPAGAGPLELLLASGLAGEVLDLARLVSTRERVLAYALGLPRLL